MVLTFISQMGRKIVNRDLHCGDPHFKFEKKHIYIVAVQIVAKLQIVLLDDTVLS